jgi:hypothetical protein
MAAKLIASKLDKRIKVIEIGTAYGTNLGSLYCPNIEFLTSIDPMYNWVPDVNEEMSFDETLIDKEKIAAWEINAAAFLPQTHCNLIVLKSSDAARREDYEKYLNGATILVIDGCHHPTSAVEADFWDYEKFMTDDYFIVMDDLNHGHPQEAFDLIISKLGASVIEQSKLANVGILHIVKSTVPPTLVNVI